MSLSNTSGPIEGLFAIYLFLSLDMASSAFTCQVKVSCGGQSQRLEDLAKECCPQVKGIVSASLKCSCIEHVLAFWVSGGLEQFLFGALWEWLPSQASPGAYWSGAKVACHQRMDMGAAHWPKRTAAQNDLCRTVLFQHEELWMSIVVLSPDHTISFDYIYIYIYGYAVLWKSILVYI